MQKMQRKFIIPGLIILAGVVMLMAGLSLVDGHSAASARGGGTVALLFEQDASGMVSGGKLYYDDLPPADGTAQAYAAAASWDHNPVTYSFLNCPSAIDCGAAQQAAREGVEAWDAVSGITLNEIGSGADIQIGWFVGNHGDGNNFDGPGNILAHAFFPVPFLGELAGDMHFDDAENWVVGTPTSDNQIHVTTVAMHEIGHALGLDHSGDPSALMWDAYTGIRGLAPDDVAGIQALYGPPNADDGAAQPPQPPAPAPSSVTATTTTAIRFRMGPGTDYRSLGTIQPGVTVPVLGRNDAATWIYVEYVGTRGWLAAWLCSINGSLQNVPVVNPDGTGAAPPPEDPGSPAPPSPPLPPGSVTVVSTVNVRIRQGPSTGYSQIGTLPAGTTVPVLGRNADNQWVYIQHGDLKGWVAAWLFTFTGDLNTVPVVDVNGNPVPYGEAAVGMTATGETGFEALTALLQQLALEMAY